MSITPPPIQLPYQLATYNYQFAVGYPTWLYGRSNACSWERARTPVRFRGQIIPALMLNILTDAESLVKAARQVKPVKATLYTMKRLDRKLPSWSVNRWKSNT